MPGGTVDTLQADASARAAASAGCRTESETDNACDKVLVIGLGNPLVSDDSVGLRIVRRLKRQLAARPQVNVEEDYWGGLRLMERMIGYRRAVVVDAIRSGAAPGTVHLLPLGTVSTQKSASAHDVNLPTALAFGRQAGALLPRDEDVCLVGIEALDVVTFSNYCTPAVAAAIPRAVEQIARLLDSMCQSQSVYRAHRARVD